MKENDLVMLPMYFILISEDIVLFISQLTGTSLIKMTFLLGYIPTPTKRWLFPMLVIAINAEQN
jgi:hypothetical protein